MKPGSKRPLARPLHIDHAARSWEEVRYAWREMSGEDLSRQRVQQIAGEAVHKLRRTFADKKLLALEFWSYLP